MIPREPKGAVFSPDRGYRYLLWRSWAPAKPWCMFIGLNPSTADETADDPTIRRCIGFAEREGCGGLFMANLFGWRSTDPRELRRCLDPNGPDNDEHLIQTAQHASIVVAAWGADPMVVVRGNRVAVMLQDEGVNVGCLGKTKGGHPKHPLYLRKDTPLELWP